MTEINIFLFSFFPQTGVTRSGNSAQQKALHLYSRGLGGREGPLMAEIYIFCFPIFFPNMSGISDYKRTASLRLCRHYFIALRVSNLLIARWRIRTLSATWCETVSILTRVPRIIYDRVHRIPQLKLYMKIPADLGPNPLLVCHLL